MPQPYESYEDERERLSAHYEHDNKQQAAQDCRDKLLEGTTLMLVALLEEATAKGYSPEKENVMVMLVSLVKQLRRLTGRDVDSGLRS